MSIIDEDGGRLNVYAKEPPMEYTDQNYRPMISWDDRAERLNGRIAMLSLIAALGAYALTGQVIPGVW
jgi:hypothetical protein